MASSSELLDEIALEGLDGITIEALWVRLQLRKGFLLSPKDDHAKAYLWNFVRRLRDVDFYQLQEPRQPLVVFDRWSNMEDDLGLVMDPNPLPVDIYPHCLISDSVNKIQGSCSSYHTRQKVTNTIRKLKLPEILDKYGPESIVMVANQYARRTALMGTHQNPHLELTDFMYCFLERVGRSRYHGETTQGKMGLQVMGVDSKMLFYFRKFLLKHKLITAQMFQMKNSNVSVAGKLIHLPRFYHLVKPKFVVLTESIVEFLATQPNYLCEVTKLKEVLGITCTLRKLTKMPEFQKYVRSDTKVLYRSVYPNAAEKDWRQKRDENKEKRIHVLYLVDPSFDRKEFRRKMEGNEDDEEEEEDGHDQGFLDQSLRVFDRPIVLQVWKILENAGPNGMSATELTRATGLGKLHMRMIVKHMEKNKICGSFMADVSRQRVRRYVVNSGNRMDGIAAHFNTEELKLNYLKNTKKFTEVEGNSAGEGCSTSETKLVESTSTFVPSDSTEKLVRTIKIEPVASTSTFVPRDSTKKQIGVNEVESTSTRTLPDSTRTVTTVVEVEANQSTSTYGLPDSTRTVTSVEEVDTHESTSTYILPDVYYNENGGEISVCTVQAVNVDQQDETMEVVEERSGGEVGVEEIMVVEGVKMREVGENSGGKGGEVEEVITEEVGEGEGGKEVVEKVVLKESRGGKAVKRSKGGENEIGGSSVPKKLKVKTVEDLNSVEEIVEENSVSQPMDVSIESSSDQSNKTTDLDVSGEDRKIEISIEITDDLIWLRDRGKFNRDEGHKTVRSLKRWNWILETIQAHKVVSNVTNILTLINDHERTEGHSGRIDRKSLFRILYRMAVDRLIKVYKVYLRSGDTVQEMNFFCSPSVTPNDPIITFAIDLAKLKFTSKVKLQHDNAAKQESKTVVKEDVILKNKFDFSEEHKSNLDVPKFMRMRYLHMFMYYLVYGYEGDVDLDQKEAAEQIRASQGFEVDDLETMSFIYVANASWKMFVPPLPQHREYKDGWALLADIILRLPLSMFMNLVRLPYIVPNLELYLDHPVKRHILVKDLPVQIRNCLIYKRKYVFGIFEVVKRLAYIGLVQLGPQNLKEKDHVYLYLNKNGLLLDTKISRPGYHRVSEDITYDEIRYYFEGMLDVERYWLDMWKICMHTKLGNRSCVVGTDLILENIQDKPDMINILLARTGEEVVEKDVGYLPGDKLGAAGFDSALFSHLKRNWAFKPFPKTRLKPVLTIPDKPNQKLRKPFKFAEGRNQMVYSLLAKRRKNLVVTSRKQVSTSKSSLVNRKPVTTTVNRKQVTKISTVNRKQVLSHKPRVTVRHVKPRPVKQRRPFYDQIDREALKRMNKLRVDWSKAEDKLLLLCKVVQSMISPQIKSGILGNMYVSFREILHKTFPNSRNKTSRACQRRINYMLRSQSTCHSLNLCIEELRHDPVIMETYGDLFEKLKSKYENKHGVIENKAKLITEWNIHFKDLFEILAKRFEDFSITSLANVTSSMPDTLEEFYANYNVIEPTKKVKTKHGFNPVENVNDIYGSVINSTIHSALCCTSDKTSWSYHLFSIYQQYPEKLLRSALAKMRTSQMVSLKRAWSRTKMRSGNYLPLTASPYRLSISYINLMAAKYTSDIFPESYELLKSIVQSRRLDLQVTSGGIAAGVVRLLTDGWVDFEIGIPDQVIVLNPNIQEKDEAYTRLMNRYQEILSSYKQQLLTTSCLFQKENYSTIEDENIPEEDSKESSNNNTIARTASRLALFLVKDSEETDGMVPLDIQHVHDFFVVNSCTVVPNLRSNLTEDQLRVVTDMRDVHTFQKQLRETVVYPANLNVNEVLNENFTGDRRGKAVKLLETAKSEGNLGLKCGRIVEEFGNSLEVKEILDELCKLKLLVCTGLVSTTYVHQQHARPWLVHTYSNKRKERDSRVPMIGGVLELGREGDVEERGNEETRGVLEEYVEGVVQDEKKEEYVEVQGDFREDATSEDKKSDLLVVEIDGLEEKEGEGEEKGCVVDVAKPGSRKRNKIGVDYVMEVDCEKRMEEEEGMEGEKGIEKKNMDGNCSRESVPVEEEMCVREERELEKDDKKKCDEEMGKKSALVDYSEKEGRHREMEEEEFGEKNIFEGSTKQKERENMGESSKGLEEEKIDKDCSKERGLVQGCIEELGGKSVMQGSSSQVFSVEDGNNQESEKSLEETEEGVSCSRKEGFIGGKGNCDTGLVEKNLVENTLRKTGLELDENQVCDKVLRVDSLGGSLSSISQFDKKSGNVSSQDNQKQFDKKSEEISSAKVPSVESFKYVNVGSSSSKQCDRLLRGENMVEGSCRMEKEVLRDKGQSNQVSGKNEMDQVSSVESIQRLKQFNVTGKGSCVEINQQSKQTNFTGEKRLFSFVKRDQKLKQTNLDGGLCMDRFKAVNYGASTSKDVVCLSEEDENMKEKRFKDVNYGASISKDVVCLSEEDENMKEKRFKDVNYGASTSKDVLCLPEDENMEEDRFKEVDYGASTSKDVLCVSEDMEEDRLKEVNYGASTSKDVVCVSEEDENMEDEMKSWGSGEDRDHSDSKTGISTCDKRARLDKIGGVTTKSTSSENPVLNEPAKSGKDTDLRNLSQPIKVLIRPWIRVDGTINRRSLDHFLSTVLSHIMQHPLSTLSELQNRFLPALQPQHTRELAELLEKLKCVESFVCVKSGKPSLFSKPCEVVIKKATGLEAPSEIRLEANKDAIVNLGKLISTKKYDEGLLIFLVDK